MHVVITTNSQQTDMKWGDGHIVSVWSRRFGGAKKPEQQTEGP